MANCVEFSPAGGYSHWACAEPTSHFSRTVLVISKIACVSRVQLERKRICKLMASLQE